jgi:hypothetical protein
MIECPEFISSLNFNGVNRGRLDINLIRRELCFPLLDIIAQEKEDITSIVKIIREACALQSSNPNEQAKINDTVYMVLQLAFAAMHQDQEIPNWLVSKINDMFVE